MYICEEQVSAVYQRLTSFHCFSELAPIPPSLLISLPRSLLSYVPVIDRER